MGRNNVRAMPEGGGMDMTPMIDVTFLLIIFFMCVTEMSDSERSPIELPQATAASVIDELPGRAVVNVLRDGAVEINRMRYDDEALTRYFKILYVSHLQRGSTVSKASVLVRADKQTEYGAVQRVMASCMNAGIWRIAFATRDPQRGM